MISCPYVNDAPAHVRPFLEICLSDLGLAEVAPNVVPGLTDDGEPRAWCAELASRWLKAAGSKIKGSASVARLMTQLYNLGRSVDHTGLLLPGDVLAWDRKDFLGRVVGKHVVVLLRSGRRVYDVVGGNTGIETDVCTITQVLKTKPQYAARPFLAP